MKLIAIGDLHLTAPTGRDGKDVRGGLSSLIGYHDKFVADLVIDQCLSYASKHRIEHVVLLGDVSDGTRLSYQAHHQLMRILKEPFQFHVILGNHDLESPEAEFGHSLELVRYARRNVKIYEQVTDAELDGAPVRFLPWPHTKFSKSRLNFSHVDMAGARQDNGLETKDGAKSEAVIINGHLHTNQTVRNTYIPGSPYQTSFGIKEGQYFAEATFSEDGWDVRYVPLKPKYVLRTVILRTEKDFVAPKPGELVRALVYPTFKGSPDLLKHYARLRFVADEEESRQALHDVQDGGGSAIEFDLSSFFESWAAQQFPELSDKILSKRKELFQ
jgi:predicted phosphodiesterase